MSLGIAIKGPEGIVLAADSRVTLSLNQPLRDGRVIIRDFHFDNSQKLLHFTEESSHRYVGVVTYGAAIIPNTQRTAHSYFQEFESELGTDRLPIEQYASRLGQFYLRLWQDNASTQYSGGDMTFIVGGFDEDDLYGKIFVVSVPSEPHPQSRNAGEGDFGMTWGGQLRVASRIVHGIDPIILSFLAERFDLEDDAMAALKAELQQHFEYRIPYKVLPLQDCVDLAILLIRTTAGIQALAAEPRGVGGLIEVATITRSEPLKLVQKKSITGDYDTRTR